MINPVGNIISGAGSVQYIGGDNVTVSGAQHVHRQYAGRRAEHNGEADNRGRRARPRVTSTGVITVNGGTIDITGFRDQRRWARVHQDRR